MSSPKKSKKHYDLDFKRQIYKWKIQLDNQARKIRELEEELEATQKKLTQSVVENELLKKTSPGLLTTREKVEWVHRNQAVLGSVQRACEVS